MALKAPGPQVRILPPRQKSKAFRRNVEGFFISTMSNFVYILFSDQCQRYYTGQTADLENRIQEHNSGETVSIKSCIPWRIVWSKQVSDRSEAVRLESAIKKRGAKRFLQDLGAAQSG